jgi:hypothetical protein
MVKGCAARPTIFAITKHILHFDASASPVHSSVIIPGLDPMRSHKKGRAVNKTL